MDRCAVVDDFAHGLLDTALPASDQEVILKVLSGYRTNGIDFHAIRTRQAGQRRFISLHVLVPGDWSVQKGHALCERIERDIIAMLPRAQSLPTWNCWKIHCRGMIKDWTGADCLIFLREYVTIKAFREEGKLRVRMRSKMRVSFVLFMMHAGGMKKHKKVGYPPACYVTRTR